MFEVVALFVVDLLVSWILLMIAVPIASRLADSGMPSLKDAAWQLLAALAASRLTALLLALLHPWVGWLGGLIVFIALLVKWFQIDFFGAVVLYVVLLLTQIFILGFVTAMLVG
jgi:hypothetical protein